MYASLALLPMGEIVARLRVLRQDIRTNLPPGARESFKKFHLYVKNYWVRQVRPERLSVFGEEDRTNNALERVHGTMARYLVKHGNVCRFIAGMEEQVWRPIWVRITQLRAGVARLPPQRKAQRNRDKYVTSVSIYI